MPRCGHLFYEWNEGDRENWGFWTLDKNWVKLYVKGGGQGLSRACRRGGPPPTTKPCHPPSSSVGSRRLRVSRRNISFRRRNIMQKLVYLGAAIIVLLGI